MLKVLYVYYACVGWVRRERAGQGKILIIGLKSLGMLVTNSLSELVTSIENFEILEIYKL